MAETKANPANADNKASVAERKRIPMSVPVSKLSVPEIPGYHLHWFRGEPGRIERALRAGYEFVDEGEVSINNTGLGADTLKNGNTDLGSRVSQAAGGELSGDNQPLRLYLMKIQEELWQEDQAAILGEGSQLDNIRKSLAGGLIGSDGQSQEDKANRYVDKARTKLPDFLTRK